MASFVPPALLNDKKLQTAFRKRLLRWYAGNARSLPWRGTTDPYRVWVSEIMLQQTTTKTVEGYFGRFLERFPSVRSLAEAELDQVNRLWEGLGYYRRCAQMHRAAREIVDRYKGIFPDSPEAVRNLPGIGRYTTGAILSIAFDRRFPILEANTVRLHARLLALQTDPTQKEANELLWNFAETILPQKHVGRFNQALMDLGSMLCTPRDPGCPSCPVVDFCETARRGLQDRIPYPKAKQQKEDRIEVALLIRKRGRILLIRYPQGARWGGLWDFPRAETRAELPEHFSEDRILLERLETMTGRCLQIGTVLETARHIVTRFRLNVFLCEGQDLGPLKGAKEESLLESRLATPEEIEHLPLHSTARRFFQKRVQN